MTIREKVIAAGVKNLKEFGYPDVNEHNILTDEVYSQFFESMLRDNIMNLEHTRLPEHKAALTELKQLQKELQ